MLNLNLNSTPSQKKLRLCFSTPMAIRIEAAAGSASALVADLARYLGDWQRGSPPPVSKPVTPTAT